MFDSALSTQQLQVIVALSSGANSTDAAAQAGVHRNTIAQWRRNNLPFQQSLSHAQYDRAMLFREKSEEMIDLAYQTLHDLLADPHTPASVRLKAALYIIEKASTPPPPKEQVPLDIEKIRVSRTPPVTIDQNANIVHPTHTNAQSAPPAQPQTIRRDSPKLGRNELCPCGSGQKFKRCCLNKPQAAAA